MKIGLISSAFAIAGTLATEGLPTSASNDIHTAQDQLQTLIQYSSAISRLRAKASGVNSTCKPHNLQVRKEWGSLSAQERIAYTSAVRCLQTKQARSPTSWSPGAKTRFDDWVATHIDQTLTIHYTGTFLAWHRWFTWEYEQSLRNECEYNGTQPYWNWGITADTGLESSPIWDGSATSMGGNGVKINQTGLDVVLDILGTETILPIGSGGGCVTSGPFTNMSVNLGPAALAVPGNITEVNPDGPMAYNPRCLKRDLTDDINKQFNNFTAIVDNIVRPEIIYDFQMLMQGYPGSGFIGVHGGGHYSMGGDPGRDFYVSPGDPAFYLHHGMIDLVWTVWQLLSPENRIYGNNSISGTGTFLNLPPSPNTTFETVFNIGYAGSGKNVTMRDMMSTVDGPFCYVYA